jgi:7-carboxy-7-deazaguanine synthase
MDRDMNRGLRNQGLNYPVAEMFTAVQFEGGRCGTLNFFLRLAGCNLSCPFCDTDLTYFDWMWLDSIIRVAEGTETRNVILTGGEPTVHDLAPLVSQFKKARFYVSMETNGTNLQKMADEGDMALFMLDWITVSPKTRVEDSTLLSWASEVKYVIPDHEGLVLWDHPRVHLQPEWNNPKAVARCVELLREHPDAHLSIQTHKYLGMR